MAKKTPPLHVMMAAMRRYPITVPPRTGRRQRRGSRRVTWGGNLSMSRSSTSRQRGSPSSPSIWSCASSSIFCYSPHTHKEIELHIHTTQRQSYMHTLTRCNINRWIWVCLAWAEKTKEEASCPPTGMDSMFRFRIILPWIMHLENYHITNIPLTS